MKQLIAEKNIRILPFDGNEQAWYEWSAKFVARADMLGLLAALTQEDTFPIKGKEGIRDASEDDDDESYKCERNEAAYNQLILCCEGRAFSIVNNAKSNRYPKGDAALAWANLKRRFQVETAAGKMELKTKFANMKLKSGQNPDDWLLDLELLKIRLAEMGSIIADEDLITHIINMTPEYSELVTSLEGTLEVLKIGVLKERILSFHRRKSVSEYIELNHAQSSNENQSQV